MMEPEQIARAMEGIIKTTADGRFEALLPSPMVQNHAAFLHQPGNGALICAWFGGTLEGKSYISIYASVLPAGAGQWGGPQRLRVDRDHSEQHPVLFNDPTGRLWLFHTPQPAGNQGE